MRACGLRGGAKNGLRVSLCLAFLEIRREVQSSHSAGKQQAKATFTRTPEPRWVRMHSCVSVVDPVCCLACAHACCSVLNRAFCLHTETKVRSERRSIQTHLCAVFLCTSVCIGFILFVQWIHVRSCRHVFQAENTRVFMCLLRIFGWHSGTL